MTSSASPKRQDAGQRAVRLGVVFYLGALVALPLVSLVYYGFAGGLGAIWSVISAPVTRSALWLTVWTGALIAVCNILFGTATAWVLVRYRFPGRALLSALVDLPLAIPTLVAGVMLATLYGPSSTLGKFFSARGLEVIFAAPGIVLALLFVTLPFVVRAVEPVLLELDPAEEEAALTLGAGPLRIFYRVILPGIAPAALSGAVRSFARALGEFGSIVVVAGNIPHKTLTAPVFIFGEIESGAPHAAAAVSLVLLALALVLHGVGRLIEQRPGGPHA